MGHDYTTMMRGCSVHGWVETNLERNLRCPTCDRDTHPSPDLARQAQAEFENSLGVF